MIQAVSANLGRRRTSLNWVRSVTDGGAHPSADLLFLQEVPADLWDGRLFEDRGYDVTPFQEPVYAVRSMIAWRRDVLGGTPAILKTAGYHGTYLAAAALDLAGIGTTTCVSVHASPSLAEQRYVDRWPSTSLALPPVRPSGRPGELWDSDFVLATLRDLASEGPVLAAGDFNECLAWDDQHEGNWGREFFEGMRDAGLCSLSHRNGNEERQTAFTHPGLTYQLDHVVVTADVAKRIVDTPAVDGTWTWESVRAEGRSDHAPLWFTIT